MPDMTRFHHETVDSCNGATYQSISCMACGQIANLENGMTSKGWAEIKRGSLAATDVDGALTDSEAADRENIKFSRVICPDCFLTDPDLCAFFNRCGCTIR